MKRASFIIAVALAASWAALSAQQAPDALPLGPSRERGASITPAFEGWYQNDDGTYSLLIGYFNRNTKQTFDIPIGPNNKIEPGAPDQGQPTFFESGRQWGVFVIKVPKDFGKKTVTWTIVSNGETQAVPFTLNPRYPITPFKELGMNNEPPVLWFSPGGGKVTGPPVAVAATLSGEANKPIPLDVWAQDEKGRDTGRGGRGGGMVANVSFHKYRGPGTVTFDRARAMVNKQGDKVTSSATFSAPGEYLLRVQANDESGEGGAGFQCCWTNAYVKVTVR